MRDNMELMQSGVDLGLAIREDRETELDEWKDDHSGGLSFVEYRLRMQEG